MKVELGKMLACCLIAVGTVVGVSVCPGPGPSASVVHAYGHWSIDRFSAWWDRGSDTFGAGVTDNDSGEYFTVAYHLNKVSRDRYNIMESKNQGPWTQIGVIDWSYMCSADIGGAESGGPLFARVANVCAQKYGYQKMF